MLTKSYASEHNLYIVDDSELRTSISDSLYSMLTEIIGNEEMIHVRRTTTNLRDDVLRMNFESGHDKRIPIFSGSKAEGLRFKSSDDDWMFVNKSIRVIDPSKSYTTLYHNNNCVLLTMENEMTRPGFTLLRVKEESRYQTFMICGSSPVIPYLDGLYVSSKKWKESQVNQKGHMHTVFNHGPCTSYEYGGKEYDHAHCLKCDIWPANALSSIQRLHQSSWPSSDILQTIVGDGVLFVPIGAKKSIFEDTEWRMSFSLAEKRLIHSMNHTQFICYGLLKLFLKEAIDANENVKGLLCSYFLKTALFWEITASPRHWNPSSLLSCFWKCFCRLLQWVSNSYCPNLFIPENNMFQGKIEGENHDKLLQHLSTLYYEGYRCLLRCTSLNVTNTVPPILLKDVLNGLQPIAQGQRCRGCVVQTIINEEQYSGPLHSICFINDTESMCLQLHRVTQTINSSHERFLTKRWLYTSLTTLLCETQSSQNSTHNKCNKSYYKHHNQRMRILNRCRIGLACHRLHQATECYNIGKYSQTLQLAQKADKAIFSQEYVYSNRMPHGKCSDVNEDLPIETMMRKSSLALMIYPEIPEFYIETFCAKLSSTFLSLPPAICALFLQYLYYHKQGHWQRRDEFLYKILQLINHADGYHIRKAEIETYTSWQVLGICQQISGDNQAAFHFYCMAIPHESDSHKTATYIRLGTILAKYFSAQRQILASCYSLIKSHHEKTKHQQLWQKEKE